MNDELTRLAESTVALEYEHGSGTGVIVAHLARNSYILTCAHVIGEATTLKVIYKKGKVFYNVKATPHLVSIGHDLALLRTNKRLDAPAMPLGQQEPEIYDRLLVVGCPDGLFGTASECTLTAKDGSNRLNRLYQFTGLSAPGMSGAPLADIYGNLVSIITSVHVEGYTTNHQIGFSIPLPCIIEFLSQKKGKKRGR